jgi:hypothetical protein
VRRCRIRSLVALLLFMGSMGAMSLAPATARADGARSTLSEEDPLFERRPIGHEADAEHESKHALPCRPTVTCTADIVPAGDLEIESGVVSRKQRTGFTLSAPLLVKYSLSHEVQFQLGGNTLTAIRTQKRSTYFDNAVGGLKLHIVDQTDKRPSLALSGSLSVPTFKADGYERAYNGVFTAYATKDFGPIHLDLNLGVNAAGFDKVATGQGYAALAVETEFTTEFGAIVEGYVFSDAMPYVPEDAGIVFALTHSPEPWLVFDVGGDVSLYQSTRVYSTFFGMTVIPATFGRP